jgi:hypothetical protein
LYKTILPSGMPVSGSAYPFGSANWMGEKSKVIPPKTLSNLIPRLNADAFLLRGSQADQRAEKI